MKLIKLFYILKFNYYTECFIYNRTATIQNDYIHAFNNKCLLTIIYEMYVLYLLLCQELKNLQQKLIQIIQTKKFVFYEKFSIFTVRLYMKHPVYCFNKIMFIFILQIFELILAFFISNRELL